MKKLGLEVDAPAFGPVLADRHLWDAFELFQTLLCQMTVIYLSHYLSPVKMNHPLKGSENAAFE